MGSQQENTEAVKELTKKVTELMVKCEVLTERLATMSKLVYGVIGVILVAVITQILKGIGL